MFTISVFQFESLWFKISTYVDWGYLLTVKYKSLSAFINLFKCLIRYRLNSTSYSAVVFYIISINPKYWRIRLYYGYVTFWREISLHLKYLRNLTELYWIANTRPQPLPPPKKKILFATLRFKKNSKMLSNLAIYADFQVSEKSASENDRLMQFQMYPCMKKIKTLFDSKVLQMPCTYAKDIFFFSQKRTTFRHIYIYK